MEPIRLFSTPEYLTSKLSFASGSKFCMLSLKITRGSRMKRWAKWRASSSSIPVFTIRLSWKGHNQIFGFRFRDSDHFPKVASWRVHSVPPQHHYNLAWTSNRVRCRLTQNHISISGWCIYFHRGAKIRSKSKIGPLLVFRNILSLLTRLSYLTLRPRSSSVRSSTDAEMIFQRQSISVR